MSTGIQHCIHIQKESRRTCGKLYSRWYYPAPSIYMGEGKKTSFTSSDTGIHLVFTLITSLRHRAHRWSLRGKTLADRKLWKKINLTLACSKRKSEEEATRTGDRGGERIDGVKEGLRRRCPHGGQDPEDRTGIMRAGRRRPIQWGDRGNDGGHPELLESSDWTVSRKTLEERQSIQAWRPWQETFLLVCRRVVCFGRGNRSASACAPRPYTALRLLDLLNNELSCGGILLQVSTLLQMKQINSCTVSTEQEIFTAHYDAFKDKRFQKLLWRTRCFWSRRGFDSLAFSLWLFVTLHHCTITGATVLVESCKQIFLRSLNTSWSLVWERKSLTDVKVLIADTHHQHLFNKTCGLLQQQANNALSELLKVID